GVNVQDHGLNELSLLQNFRWMFDPLCPGQVRDVYQAVDTFFDLDEGAEIGHVADAAFDHRADTVAAVYRRPGIRFELFQPQRNPPFVWMDFQHHRLDLIARPYNFRRMFHSARPRHLGNMDQAFHSGFEFHERAVIRHIHDVAHYAAVQRIALFHGFPRVGLE